LRPAPSLIVLAGAWDNAARDFAARHARRGVSLLVPRDLSRSGWHFRPGDPAAAVAVMGPQRFRLGEAGGVLTRLPAVTEADLPHIAAEDRAYIAAELTAFLLALLASTAIHIVNRPTPQCLCGPAWHDGRWRRAAGECGFKVRAVRGCAVPSAAPLEDEPCGAKVTVVGEVAVGAPNRALRAAARAVAAAAGAELLTVEFDKPGPGAALLRARPSVDIGDPPVEKAVLRLFGLTGARRGRKTPDDRAVGG
jgi:hypothetical protein